MSLPQPSDGFEWTQASWGPVLRCRPLLELADHFFTVANLQLRDDPAEWRDVARQIGVQPDDVLLIRQVHGASVIAARSDRTSTWTRPEADVIVSDDRGSAIGVRVADCAPILLADRRRGGVAAAHAGWRGTVHRAARAAVRGMEQTFESRPIDLVAAIGPSLGVCCGEVGPEVRAAFLQAGHEHEALSRWFTPGDGDREHLDLARANRDQLEAAGIPAAQIHVAGLCTKSHPAVFHSYRAARDRAGRMVAVIRPR